MIPKNTLVATLLSSCLIFGGNSFAQSQAILDTTIVNSEKNLPTETLYELNFDNIDARGKDLEKIWEYQTIRKVMFTLRSDNPVEDIFSQTSEKQLLYNMKEDDLKERLGRDFYLGTSFTLFGRTIRPEISLNLREKRLSFEVGEGAKYGYGEFRVRSAKDLFAGYKTEF